MSNFEKYTWAVVQVELIIVVLDTIMSSTRKDCMLKLPRKKSLEMLRIRFSDWNTERLRTLLFFQKDWVLRRERTPQNGVTVTNGSQDPMPVLG